MLNIVYFEFLNPEDGTDRLCQNVGKKLPLLSGSSNSSSSSIRKRRRRRRRRRSSGGVVVVAAAAATAAALVVKCTRMWDSYSTTIWCYGDMDLHNKQSTT
jgi:ferric-dicitrate binding protein FerR (iron transport regulator)